MHTYALPIPFIKKTTHLILLYFLMTGEMPKKKQRKYVHSFFLGGLLLDCPNVEFFGARSGLVRPSEVKRMRIMINIPLLGPLGYRPVADRRNGGTFVLGEWMSYPSLKFARKINHQVDLNIKIVGKGLAGQCLFVLESWTNQHQKHLYTFAVLDRDWFVSFSLSVPVRDIKIGTHLTEVSGMGWKQRLEIRVRWHYINNIDPGKPAAEVSQT